MVAGPVGLEADEIRGHPRRISAENTDAGRKINIITWQE
jgi:hypothetical protein